MDPSYLLLEPEASFDPVELSNSEPKASSEPDAPLELEENPNSVPVSVSSSLDKETMTTPEATFCGCHELL